MERQSIKVSSFLASIRIQNLGLLFFLQMAMYWLGTQSAYSANFDIIPFLLSVLLPTLLIGAFGNIFNDYIDLESDQINKKRSFLYSNFSKKDLGKFSIILGIIAIAFSLLSYYFTENIFFTLLLIISGFCLALYSLHLKCASVFGNLCIALLSLLAVVLPHLFIISRVDNGRFASNYMLFLLGFTFMVFLITLIREIVKDLEDIKGDRASGCHTIPIKHGVQFSRNVVLSLLILAILILMTWAQNFSMILNGYMMLVGVLPLIFIASLIVKSNKFQEISTYLKYLMLLFSFSIILFNFFS